MKFYLSTYYDGQIPIISKDGFERDGTIYGETLMINQRQYTLTEFRRKFEPTLRRKIIRNFLAVPGDDLWSWEDHTVKRWEEMLVEKLTG